MAFCRFLLSLVFLPFAPEVDIESGADRPVRLGGNRPEPARYPVRWICLALAAAQITAFVHLDLLSTAAIDPRLRPIYACHVALLALGLPACAATLALSLAGASRLAPAVTRAAAAMFVASLGLRACVAPAVLALEFVGILLLSGVGVGLLHVSTLWMEEG